MALVRLLALAATAFLFPGCMESTPSWEQDAYVWSGSHLPDEATATLPLSRHRLLVLQWQVDAGSVPRSFDRRAWLDAQPETPIVAVVRLDGYRIDRDPGMVADALAGEIADWPRPPIAVEIDHDAATARVAEYAAWLSDFREDWKDRSPIWITALPDWQHSPQLRTLLRSVDAVTLQVHAVDRPDNGLLDPERALTAVGAFEQLAATTLFVALPTYQLRVGWDADGSVRFVEGEQPVAGSAAREQTLFVEPEALAALARTLQSSRPPHRRGIAWYRLPRQGDRQSLSMATFGALVRGEPLAQHLIIEARPGAEGLAHDLVLHNPGPLDGSLPAAIAWADGCMPGDAAFGYRLGTNRASLERESPGLLRAGETRTIGWLHCPTGQRPVPAFTSQIPY